MATGLADEVNSALAAASTHKLSKVPTKQWTKIREALPSILLEIGPVVPNQLGHLPSSAPIERIIAYLHRDGAVIIDNAVSESTCDDIEKEMRPYIDACDSGAASFLGKVTKRAGSVAARSRASWEILAHPILMDVCAGVLGQQLLSTKGSARLAPGYKENPWQLHLTQIIEIGASEPAQPIHRDRWAFVADGCFETGGVEPEISTIWALTEFTLESGPTRVVPGSHRWPADEIKHGSKEDQARLSEQTANAVMSKGSVVIYTGSTLHSGGNNVSGRARTGLNVDYNLAWLRQEENQYLACPPNIAKDLPPHVQRLLGYETGGYALGYYGDLQHPTQFWKETKPLNWASDWQSKL